MVTLSSHHNFSVLTDQVTHVYLVLSFSPISKTCVLSRSKPHVPKLACQIMCLHSCSICSKLSCPEGACGDLGVYVQESMCLFPAHSLPPSTVAAMLDPSIPLRLLRNTTRHGGPEKQRRKLHLVQVSPRKSSFPGSWYLAAVCPKMDFHLLFFAAELLQLDMDQALVPLLIL